MINNKCNLEAINRKKKVSILSGIVASINIIIPNLALANTYYFKPYELVVGTVATYFYSFGYTFFSAYGVNYFKPTLDENNNFIKPSNKLKLLNGLWHLINLTTIASTIAFSEANKNDTINNQNNNSVNIFKFYIAGLILSVVPYVVGLHLLNRKAKKEMEEKSKVIPTPLTPPNSPNSPNTKRSNVSNRVKLHLLSIA